ncbi:UvrD-helicase domain-containing protein [Clostridium sp. PL3]|uniref:DNA 3'-5' helicase n=1 Tax=Clostridium thailandense TaxID=2794346 RepID=A0A949U0V2_9CLOT|nr:UvrD-helicase domain-containing protein [Clostridium thailandense]MBV7275371.1 UvrD-helicase domain-containing protein [Clostridium thailandense]
MVENILDTLNEEQIEAVTTTEGYIRVIAGAGSGKTKALTHRFAYLVNELGIATSSILCVTFTNKAANEMKKRIRNLIGDNDTGYVSTFHGFCVTILREDIHVLHYPKNFIVIDTEDANSILQTIYQDMGINSRNFTFDMAKNSISFRKSNMNYLENILSLDNNELKEKCLNARTIEEGIFYRYICEQKKCYALDFDDLMNFVLYIFTKFEEIRLKWQKRLEYVMVDEFQDVSIAQYNFATILSGYHNNLFIVGDPDQTIYSWRGSKVEFILNFDKEFPKVKTIILNKNYRSTPNILNASNSLIRKNKNRIDKDLVPVKDMGIPVLFNHAKTTKLEAKWIVKQIRLLLESGKKLKAIAILYRSHFVSRSLEEEFIKENIKYILYSGIEFYKRKEIKDVLCYLRIIAYADDISFIRVINVPKRNIGDKRITFLKEYAENKNYSLYDALKYNIEVDLISKTKAKEFLNLIEKYKAIYNEMKISDLITSILNDSGYEAMLRVSGEQDRLDNLAELKQSIFDYEKNSGEESTLEGYLEKIALFTNLDQKERSDSVKMMTIHTAKGLEFPYVFVCGLNEGIFPSKHVNTIDKLEEERRLAYVAYTRAENALFLSDAEGINYDGSFRYPSRFIFNTEKAFLNYETELEESLVEEAQLFIEQNEKRFNCNDMLFSVGDIIEHKVFGKGEILELNENSSSYVIKFEKMETTRNISFKTKLELSNLKS